jgi:hypothetical protein
LERAISKMEPPAFKMERTFLKMDAALPNVERLFHS